MLTYQLLIMTSKNTPLEDVYLFHLDRTFKQYKKSKKNFFKKLGLDLTSDQWIVLKRVSEVEGITQKDLASSTYKEPASITRILDILERKNYIERRSTKEDRRVYELYLTKEGRKTVDEVIDAAIEGRAKGVKGFSEEEVKTLINLLSRMHDNFTEEFR